MLLHAEQGAAEGGLRAWLEREHAVTGTDLDTLTTTYRTLKRLYDEGLDHIWGYVSRNLSRPVWLSSTGQRANVLVGNPPWLSYRYMSKSMQERFKSECEARGIWAGGKVATHQDLSAYFYAKCAELYLQAGGLIAFVMPYAALNRKQFEGFRTGWFGIGRFKARRPQVVSEVRFVETWTFDESVKPLFEVPSCVLFAENRGAGLKGGLPGTVLAFHGTLPRRDATPIEAAGLRSGVEPLPEAPTLEGGSVYRAAFR
jgi:methylase of polypeptide subunit release factors